MLRGAVGQNQRAGPADAVAVLRGTEERAPDVIGGAKEHVQADELLGHLWKEIIDLNLREASLDNIISHCKRTPDGAFADTGPAIERILAAGASRRDLCLVMRSTAYEAGFGTLYGSY